MTTINWDCEATSHVAVFDHHGSVKRSLSQFRPAIACATLVLLAVCTAATALAEDIPGELAITHSVSAAGASVASIPIPTLPGAGGLEPKLVLSYSSQNGNTGFGLGWSLNGYSTLVRGTKTRDVDGAPGPITYQNDDAFYLNGERIVPVAQLSQNDTAIPWWLQTVPFPKGAIEYRKWIDDGTLVIAILTDGSDAAHPAIDRFIAETKSGIRTEFTTKVSDATLQAAAIYLPSRSIDTAGDYILWHFDISGLAYQLSSVLYTGLDGQHPIAPFATIQFAYEPAPRPLLSHLLGLQLSRTQRLKSVVTTLNGSSGVAGKGMLLTLAYQEAPASSTDAYYLAGAQLTTFGDNIPGVSFSYKALPDASAWQQLQYAPSGLPSLGGVAIPNVAYQLGTSWANATQSEPALFLSKYSNGKFLSKTYLYSANGWTETESLRAPPVPFVNSAGKPLSVVLMDIDGDGLTDLVQLNDQGKAFLQNQALGRWQADLTHKNVSQYFQASELPLMPVQPLRLGSYAKPRQDLLVKVATGSYAVVLNTPGRWVRKNDASLNFSPPAGNEIAIGDFNGDGLDDRVDLVLSGSSLSLEIYTSDSQTWVKQTSAVWAWTAPVAGPLRLRTIKINKTDPCESLLISIYDAATQKERLFVLQGSKTNGWVKKYDGSAPGGALFFESDGTPLSPALLDVNSDGLTDLVLDQIDNHGSKLQQTWLQSNQISGSIVSWIHDDTKYGPPPVIINDPQNYILAPWNGPSLGAAVIALPSPTQAAGSTYLSDANGWQNANLNLTPSVSLVTPKQNISPVQFVDLNGDGLQDVVYNDDQGSRGAQFNSAGQGWTQHSEFSPPQGRPLAKPGDLGTRATFVDVNGDGYVDLVYSYVEAGNTVTEIYLNGTPLQGCKGWAIADQNCHPPDWHLPQGVVLTDVARGDLGCRFADINGDGLPDIICGVLDSSAKITAHGYINNGRGTWDEIANYSLPAAFVFDSGSGPTLNLGTQLIDLDGDRLPALIAAYRNPLNSAQGCQAWCGIFKNHGGNFDSSSNAKLPVMLDAEYYVPPTDGYQVNFMDIDGDGLPDIVQFTNGQAQVYLGNGVNWDSPNSSWTISGDATSLNFGGTQFIDVNGDGRVDIIYSVQGGASGVRLNTGSGWTPEGQNSNLAPALPFITSSGDDLGVRLIDVTGDGAPDQIQSTGTAQQAYKNPGARVGMLASVTDSSGVITNYSYQRLVEFADYKPLGSEGTQTTGIPLVPFSPVVWRTVRDESFGRCLITTYNYEGFRFDLSNSIALGFAGIEHTDQAEDAPNFSVSHRTRFRQEPHLVGHPRSEQTIINQGSQSIVVDEVTKSWDQRHVNVVLNGTPAPGYLQIVLSKSVSKTFDLNGTANIASNVETTFTYDDWLNANTVQVSKPKRATQTLVNQYLGTDYARYGRLTTSTSSVTDSTGTKVSERTSTFTYFDVSVPQRFLLNTEAIDVGDDQLNSRTTYTRDDRGNIASTTKTAVNALRRLRSNASATPSNGSSRTNSIRYDADLLRQVTRRTDAQRHNTELEYPPNSIGSSLSLPTRSIDPNQLISIQTYDGLGRTVTISTPDKVTHHFYRYLSAQIPAEWLAGIDTISSVIVPSQNPPTLCPSAGRTLTWTQQQIGFAEEARLIASSGVSRLLGAKIYDTGKRVIRSITVRTDGMHTLLTFADSKYDTQGRLVAHSLPYFAGKTPYWTAYDYDALDRRTLTVRPDGAISRLCYSVTAWGLQETLVDARNHATVVQLNLDGKPLTITRPDKGHVDLSYDAMGRVNSVRSPSGAMTTLDFDGLGNRRLVKDPNAGTIEYSYDAFGELREQRSGSQQPIELDYDELGRKTWEGRYDQETTWTFDMRGAIGQPNTITLTTQNSPTILTYVESYHYDRYARLSRTLTKLDATASSHGHETHFSGAYAFSYDPYSVLDGVVYPTSISNSGPLLQIKRQYDAATGQLREVDDVTNGNRHYLWKLQSANASGHTQRASFGNGTRETKIFDPSTDRIKSFSVADSPGKSLLTEVYSYDPVGNLLSRLSDGHDLEEFEYDEQNRLNSVERSRKTVSVTYDSDDRIRIKSDVGEYHYFGDTDYAKYCHSSGNSAPDAVCAVQRDEETTDTFEYDEFGNVRNHESPAELGRRSTAVDYTSDHHVASLSVQSTLRGPATAQFFYGPAGQRILSREKNDGRYKETVHMGLYDRISVKRSSTLALVTDRFYVLGDQGVFLTVDATNPGHTSGAGSPGLHTTALYQHHDRLGSIVLLTKNDGRIGARMHYDPWGKASGGLHPSEDDNSHLDIAAAWTRGFAGQDHIPDFDLIHMTGRVYDPRLGIFLSVDLLGGQAQTGGDLNPYLYADGNPLAIVDPTGFCGWSDPGSCLSGIGQAIGSVGQAIGNAVNSVANTVSSALQNAAQWVSQNWREVATVAVIAVVTFATAGTGTGPVVAATLAGAAGGATEAALYGGSVQDVIGAAIEGAVFGGFSAGLANAGLSWEASEFAHGFVGGFQSAMSGQDFARGFVIGALSQVSGNSIAVSYTSGWSVAEQVAVSAVVNGAVSEAQGDKFANGALTGVFQQLYLDADQGQWQIKSVIEAANILVSSNQPQFGVGGIISAVGVIQQSLNMTTSHFVSGYAEVGSFLNILQTGANDLTELETAVEALKSKPPAPGVFSPGFAF